MSQTRCGQGHLLLPPRPLAGSRGMWRPVSQALQRPSTNSQEGQCPCHPPQGQSDNLAQHLRGQGQDDISHEGSGGVPGAAAAGWPCWCWSGLRERGSHWLQSQQSQGTALAQLCIRGLEESLLFKPFCNGWICHGTRKSRDADRTPKTPPQAVLQSSEGEASQQSIDKKSSVSP